jgi:hypothetical protein
VLGDRGEGALVDPNSLRVAEMCVAGEEDSHDVPI